TGPTSPYAPSAARDSSAAFQSHVLVGRREERVAGHESDARLLDPRSHAAHGGQLPDRGEDRLVVHELLDAVQRRLASLPIQLDRLLAEQAVDIRIASVHVGALGGDEGLDPRGGVAERAAGALD